ncbi:integral membrane protein [Neisseria meningitidis]|nr:integral membrane protein [Neisseria meningitidis]CWS47211.1 integral membrane protein [Neisseria meningitidis]
MGFYALLLIALGMSMDAFAVALAKGAAVRMPPRKIAATALVFGTVEALTPLAGWVGGFYAKPFISEWDHWVAFVLLGGLGLKMMREGLSGEAEDVRESKRESLWMTVLTAFGTSIDSMIVGVGLAFMEVKHRLCRRNHRYGDDGDGGGRADGGKGFGRIVRQVCGICRRFGVDCHRHMDALVAFGFDSMMSENIVD